MPKLVQKRLDEGRAVCDLSEGPWDPEGIPEAQDRRRLVWADDHASLYAALPGGLMEIKTYFYDAEGAEIARRTSRGTRFVALEVRDQGKWPRVARIVATTPEGRTVRDIEIGRRDRSSDGPGERRRPVASAHGDAGPRPDSPLAVHGLGPFRDVR